NDAAFALMHAHFGILREDVLRTAKQCFGHRLMMDCVVPGGVNCDLDDDGRKLLIKLISSLRERLPRLIDLYDNTASLQDRTRSTGYLDPELARRFAAGGFVGRGSGRDFDARRDLAYEPYQLMRFEVPVRTDGDVDSRVWIRIDEVEQSLALCDQILSLKTVGNTKEAPPEGNGKLTEGFALVEGFRGDILLWLRLDEQGKISRCYPRDPSQFHWPLLEAVIENNIVADFPLCNKSFNCSYSGSDL
ncbi:MAG TPA: hydrogenase expression protein HypE, partial [Rhizobiales bacterium]|nr:hydrogenase expression protein HypE [Hyphomicrobiales bacterium]